MKASCSLFFLLFLVLSACTEPITVGSDLLDADRASVGQSVDFPFTTRVVRADSLFTFSGTQFQLPTRFTFGEVEDPNFGLVRQSVYLTPLLPQDGSTRLPIPAPFAESAENTVDSVVLLIPIDTARGFYGPGRDFPISLRQIRDSVSFLQDYFSTVELPTGTVELAESAQIELTEAPILVGDTAIFGGELRRPHLRIRFTDAFAQSINDLPASAFSRDSLFRERFAGVYLRPTGPSDALVALLPNASREVDTVYNGFNVYYSNAEGEPRLYRIGLLQALPRYEYDFSGSLVQTLLDDGVDNELAAVAGQGGLLTEISLGDLSAFRDRVINRAELSITVAEVDGVDYGTFPPPTRLELWYRETPGSALSPIGDRSELLRVGSSTAVTQFFLGGSIDADQTYDPAFSIHMQRILDGTVPPRMYLRVTPTSLLRGEFRPNRAFLNGPAAAEQPAKISLTFTDLN